MAATTNSSKGVTYLGLAGAVVIGLILGAIFL